MLKEGKFINVSVCSCKFEKSEVQIEFDVQQEMLQCKGGERSLPGNSPLGLCYLMGSSCMLPVKCDILTQFPQGDLKIF